MESEKAFQAIDTLVGGMDEAERNSFFEHLRATYPQELGATALNVGNDEPAGGAGEASAALSVLPEVNLIAEQQEKVAKLTTAMAEKFGVAETDFSVLSVETAEDKIKHFVVYTAANGINLGGSREDRDEQRAWHSIFSANNTENFQITVGDKSYDTRTGMNREVYEAFIDDAKARGVDPLPDSYELSNENGEVETSTWLTGQPMVNDTIQYTRVQYARVQYARVQDGQVFYGWSSGGNDSLTRRFRPAVAVE